MSQKGMMIIADYAMDSPLTLEELCGICQISPHDVHDLIAYEIIHFENNHHLPENEWQFDLMQLQRVKTALRLQHDLEVNLAGAALVLDLLDEMEQLRAHAELLEKHFVKR